MEESVNYQYQASTTSIALKFLMGVILITPFGCLLFLILTIFIGMIAESLFSIPPSSILPVSIFLIFTTYILYQFFQTLRFISIDNNSLHWRKWIGKEQKIIKDKITTVAWKNETLIFNDNSKLNLSGLPSKENILVRFLLTTWIPEIVQPVNVQEYLQWTKSITKDSLDETPIAIETNKQKLLIVRWAGIVFLAIFSILLFSTNFTELNLSVVIVFIIPISFLLLVVWFSTTYKFLSITNEGIFFQQGKKQRKFHWENIEVISIQHQSRYISIWVDGKKRHISYKRMKMNNIEDVVNAIYHRAIIHNIPFAFR